MTISCKSDILCHNHQCPYDQWLVHVSKVKQLNKNQIRTIQKSRIVETESDSKSNSSLKSFKKCKSHSHKTHEECNNTSNIPDKTLLSTFFPGRWLKLCQTRSKKNESSFPDHIRIPADPRAPHAFTMNVVTPSAKTKKNCLSQPACVVLIFLVSSVISLTVVLIYLSQVTQVMTTGMTDH